MRHAVSDVDPEARTGICAVCGPVTIYRNSQYKGEVRWRCGKKSLDDQRRRQASASDLGREARLLREFGITVEEYDRLLSLQDGRCARCRREPQRRHRLAVDHCHKTGRVRGLLCGPCNTYLGRLEANLAELENDLIYIEAQPIVDKIRAVSV